MTKYFFVFLLISSIYSICTKAELIKIDKIEGQVLRAKTGSFQARYLSTGQEVRENTVINSRKNSFARLRFHENSTLVVGPETNIKIESHKVDSPTIIYLSKGIVRPKIEKDLSTGESSKFYILTPTGMVGVKGTEFLVHYNDKNMKTSVLTFKGSVRFAMIDIHDLKKNKIYSKKIEKEYTRDENNNVRLKNIQRTEVPDHKKIQLALDKYFAKEVKPGQYSETVSSMNRSSLPILISPIQLNILFRNANLKYEYSNDKIEKAALKLIKKKTDIPFETPTTSPSGIIDYANKEYAPKSGGFFDIRSGHYISPGKDSLFLKKVGLFIADSIGDIDSRTGQYIPPLGLELDPVRGFVNKQFTKDAPETFKKEILNKRDKFNDLLKNNIVLGSKQNTVMSLNLLSKREMISRDVVSLTINGVSHTLSTSNDTAATDRDYQSDGSSEYTLLWEHKSSKKWQPTMAVSWQHLSYSEQELRGAIQEGERLFNMKLGYRYSASPDWNITLVASLDQLYFLDHNATTDAGEGNDAMKRVTLPRFHLELESELYTKGRFRLEGMFAAMYSLGRSPGNLEVGSGIGAKARLVGKYWFKRKIWLGLNLSRSIERYSVSNLNFSYTAIQKASKAGLNLGFLLK